MVQDQLVDYISSQLKLGVSRESLKASLVGAGWAIPDVEETLKKVEGATQAAVVKPAVVPSTPISVNASSTPAGGAGPSSLSGVSVEKKSIRVSDLVSGNAAVADTAVKQVATTMMGATAVNKDAKPAAMSMGDVTVMNIKSSTSAGTIVKIALGAIVVALAGLSGYFYWQNNDLASKIASLGGESAAVTSQIAGLEAQVRLLTASNTALVAQADTLAGENAEIKNNLSFMVAPQASGAGASTSTPASEETVSITGVISQKKASYVLTTSYGVMVYVKNTTSTAVITALTPFVGSANAVELTGTHIPGSQYLTVTAVNGTSLSQ